jgi:heme exporter protein C
MAQPDSISTSTSAGTGTPATRALGIATILAMAWLVAFGLGFSPADRDQDEAVRILYVHVPTIWVAYLAFVVTAVASGLYLFGRRHSLGFDRVAGASAEIGVAFVAVTLVVGALWGRLTWGVFWQWDARLTTTALLFVTYIGYLAVRRLEGSHEQRARRSAVIGLLAVLEIPLVHWSVRLWRSLHQEPTVLRVARAASHASDGDGGRARRPRPRGCHRRPTGRGRDRAHVMEDAGFIIGSYALTFGVVALLAWRYVRHGRRLASKVPDSDKPWT